MAGLVGVLLGLLLVFEGCDAINTEPGFRVAFTSKALAYCEFELVAKIALVTQGLAICVCC